MRYLYPKISNTLTYKKIDNETVEVTDHLNDNIFHFDFESVRYFRQLNGYTHPYKISSVYNRNEIYDLLRFLDEYSLIRHSDIIKGSFGTKMKTVWIPTRSIYLKLYAYLSNSFLCFLWLPTLIAGIIMFINSFSQVEYDGLLVGYIIGLISGMVVHELGHVFAGIAYGAPVFEMGVMLMYYILPGAYVLMDQTSVKKRMHRIQIYAAGVEANFMLCGIFLILSSLAPASSGLFLCAAICNGAMGVFNLTFIKGFDGTSIISELLGADDVLYYAITVLFNRRTRARVLNHGCIGYVVMVVCSIFLLLQVTLPIICISTILEIIECFV